LHKEEAGIAPQAGDVFQVTSVGQFVEVKDGFVALGQPVEHEIGTDKSSTSNY
jgi:hypothetical protein